MTDLSLKEIVASILSISIVGVMLWLVIQLFIGDPTTTAEVYHRKGEILQALLGLAGTVAGYYFGRIPAENSARMAQATADQANQTAANSQTRAAAAEADKSKIAGQVRELATQLSTDAQQYGPAGGGGARQVDIQAELNRVVRGLNIILK